MSVSFHESMEGLHELSNLFPALAFSNRVADAAVDMLSHNSQSHLIEGPPGRRQLLDDVDAVALGFDHATNPADLAFDSTQSRQEIRVPGIHPFYSRLTYKGFTP